MNLADIISVIQRWINIRGIENVFRNIGLKMDLGKLIGDYITAGMPVSLAQQLTFYINNKYNDFINKPAEQIANEIQAGGTGYVPRTDLNFDIFGLKFTVKGETEKFLLYAGIALVAGVIIYAAVKTK